MKDFVEYSNLRNQLDFDYTDQAFKCRLFGPKLKKIGLKLANEEYIHDRTLLAGDIVLIDNPDIQVGVYTSIPEPGDQTIYASLQSHHVLREIRRRHSIPRSMSKFLERFSSNDADRDAVFVQIREKLNQLI